MFDRGYLPVEDELEAVGSFYNANSFNITPRALLHFKHDGEEVSIERDIATIEPGQMSYINLSNMFSDVSLEGVAAAYLLEKCDYPMHRPNHYIQVKGTRQFIDTFHQTRGKPKYWAKQPTSHQEEHLKCLSQNGVAPWKIVIPILDSRFEMDSYLGIIPSLLSQPNTLVYQILDENGRQVMTDNFVIDEETPQFTNLNECIYMIGSSIKKGSFCILPKKGSQDVGVVSSCFWGIRHRNFPYPTTSFISGSKEAGLPFYIAAGFPKIREYTHSYLQHSELFSPGIVSKKYDSLLVVNHMSLLEGYSKDVEYRLEICDKKGRLYVVNRSIKPNSHDAFWLSELLVQNNLPLTVGSFTVWTCCDDRYLKTYHGLYNKSTHSLSFDDASEGTLQAEPQV